jgi:hypothetical protein
MTSNDLIAIVAEAHSRRLVRVAEQYRRAAVEPRVTR